MKAIVWTAYGAPDVLAMREVEKPVPQDNEVLIKIRAATVTAGDCELRSLKIHFLLRLPLRLFLGFRRPDSFTALGMEIAGEIEDVGDSVTRFKKGDAVVAAPGLDRAAYAEYVTLPEDAPIILKPANMSFEEAAAIPVGGSEAYHFLRQANLQTNQRLLINGSGGSIGTSAIQLAKAAGVHVTAIDHGDKLAFLREVGADEVIDYTQEDFTKNGQTYDIIFDVVGNLSLPQGSSLIE